MADNVSITAGTGTDVATDEIGGVHYQRMKLSFGADGTASDASAANPLPVTMGALATVAHGRVTVSSAGTRVQFGAQTADTVTVKAARNNQGVVYLGGASVAAANGFQLDPGDAVVLDVANTNVLYVDAAVSGDYVTWLVVD